MPNTQDSDPVPGTEGVPTPEVSKEQGAQPSSQGPSPEDALFEKVVSRLDSIIDKRLQSTKDKRFKVQDEIAPTLGEFKKYLDAHKGDVEAAAKDMELDQIRRERFGRTQQPEQPAQLTDLERRTQSILKKAGIANDDPEVAQMASKSYASEDDWFGDLVDLAARRKTGAKPTTPTTTPTVVNDLAGKTPPANPDPAKALDKVPFGDSRSLYQMAREEIAKKGRRTGD